MLLLILILQTVLSNDFSPIPQHSDSDLEASVLSEAAVMEELTSLFDDIDLKSRMKEMYSKDEKARGAIKRYLNKVKKLNRANDESWKNQMFDLSKNPSIMLQGGRKSTKSSYIGVQPASCRGDNTNTGGEHLQNIMFQFLLLCFLLKIFYTFGYKV